MLQSVDCDGAELCGFAKHASALAKTRRPAYFLHFERSVFVCVRLTDIGLGRNCVDCDGGDEAGNVLAENVLGAMDVVTCSC